MEAQGLKKKVKMIACRNTKTVMRAYCVSPQGDSPLHYKSLDPNIPTAS